MLDVVTRRATVSNLQIKSNFLIDIVSYFERITNQELKGLFIRVFLRKYKDYLKVIKLEPNTDVKYWEAVKTIVKRAGTKLIRIASCTIDRVMVEGLKDILQNVDELRLYSCKFEGNFLEASFSEIIRNSRLINLSIEKFSLTENFFKLLLAGISQTIKILSLKRVGVDFLCSFHLANFVIENRTLEELEVCFDNKTSDKQAQYSKILQAVLNSNISCLKIEDFLLQEKDINILADFYALRWHLPNKSCHLNYDLPLSDLHLIMEMYFQFKPNLNFQLDLKGFNIHYKNGSNAIEFTSLPNSDDFLFHYVKVYFIKRAIINLTSFSNMKPFIQLLKENDPFEEIEVQYDADLEEKEDLFFQILSEYIFVSKNLRTFKMSAWFSMSAIASVISSFVRNGKSLVDLNVLNVNLDDLQVVQNILNDLKCSFVLNNRIPENLSELRLSKILSNGDADTNDRRMNVTFVEQK